MKLTDHEVRILKDEIVLMVQKSGDHQFSLLVYHLLFTRVVYILSVVFSPDFLKHQQLFANSPSMVCHPAGHRTERLFHFSVLFARPR